MKAAKQGHARSQRNLGLLHCTGEGVPLDYIEAYKWMILAVANGDEDARKSKDHFRGQMTFDQIEKAQHRARKFLGQ